MKLLITNAVVCDPQSAFHGKKCDILINNDFIEDIQPVSKKAFGPVAKTLDAKGALLSPGWVDMRAALREPGFEYKEDLDSGARAAAAGGFTTVVCLPSTQPPVQTKAEVEFILRRSTTLPVHILPYGALTQNREGKEMTEMFDMHQAGAVGFTDGNKSTMQAGVMMRSLMYSKIFGGLVLSHAEDANIAAGGRMHEGTVSVNLGLKGIPNIAEELMITRDIELAKYTEAPIHFSHISSKGSVEIIRKAKKQGVDVTCDVAVANLVYTEEALETFDSYYKLTPPLRSKADQKALWDGVADGTIDCIVSDHHPEDAEHKNVEFEYAAYGMIQFQTAYSLLNMHMPKNVQTEQVITALTSSPRKILKRDAVSIAKGQRAEITLFDPQAKWTYNEQNNISRSRNSPALGLTLTGRVIATIVKDQLFKHSSI